jgi:hypothetical protein
MSKLDDAKNVANTYLDEVVATVEIRQSFTKVLIPSSGTLLGNQSVAYLKPELQKALKHRHAQPNATYKPLVVQVCGIFESYVRSVTQAVIEDRFETAESYWDLSEAFRNDHITHAANVLAHLKKGHVMGAAYRFDDLLLNLGKGLGGQKGYKLNPEIFTKLMGNPTAKRLEGLFSTLSLPEPFSDDLGKSLDLQNFFNERAKRRVAKLARDTIDEKIDLRNKIVHGDLTLVVDLTDIEETVSFFRALISGLHELVQH